jgi:hypothetical protein
MNNGIPRFELVAKRRPDGTYENVEYVDILIPGDNRNSPRRKVTESIKEKYRPYYEQWRAGMEESSTGTPLEMWPSMTPAQVHALKAVNVFTVEDLAAVADANTGSIPFGRTVRNQARAWLETKRKSDAVEIQTRENEALKDGMRQMEEQIAALQTALNDKMEVEQPVPPSVAAAPEKVAPKGKARMELKPEKES